MSKELREEFIKSLYAQAIDRNRYSSCFRHFGDDKSFIDDCLNLIEEGKCHREARSRVAFLLYVSGNPTHAIALWEEDIKEGNAGWWQQARYAEALASAGQIDKAIAEADRIYAEFPDAVNLRSCIALEWKNTGNMEGVCSFVQKDDLEGKMTPGGRLNYVRILAKAGYMELAEEHVTKAYTLDESLKDGRLIIAEASFNHGDDAHALWFLLKDEREGRLSNAASIAAARYYYFVGDEKEAFARIEKFYKEHPEAKDAYASLGWNVHARWSSKSEQAWNLLQLDYKLKRLSSKGFLNRAIISYCIMGLDYAVSLCAEEYKKDKDIEDLYSELAWQLLHDGRIDDALRVFALDHDAGTMSEIWKTRYMETMNLFNAENCDN